MQLSFFCDIVFSSSHIQNSTDAFSLGIGTMQYALFFVTFPPLRRSQSLTRIFRPVFKRPVSDRRDKKFPPFHAHGECSRNGGTPPSNQNLESNLIIRLFRPPEKRCRWYVICQERSPSLSPWFSSLARKVRISLYLDRNPVFNIIGVVTLAIVALGLVFVAVEASALDYLSHRGG